MIKTNALAFALVLAAACATPPSPPKAPVGVVTPAATPMLTSADVDASLAALWKGAGVTPSDPADDATFLRRVTLDLTGTLPTPERVTAYLSDSAPDKRSKLVDELIASDAFIDHWTAYWDALLMGDARAGDLDRQAFRVWLRDQLARNVPWDGLVYSLVTATGKNSSGGAYAKSLDEAQAERAKDAQIDGAVNYVLKYRDNPQDLAGAASKAFLGVQIQCAQCHDHKTEKWRQTDFQSFASCFTRTQVVPLGDKGMKGIKPVLLRDLDRPAPRFDKNADLSPITRARPTALDGTELTGNARQAVASWITKSPWFAEEIVNRMWGHFLGRGFTDPVDDVRASNPPVAPELMKRLARDFTEHGSDLRRLMKLITSTRAYGLGAAPIAGAQPGDVRLWSRFRMTPLGPEELVNALIAATGTERALERLSRADIDDVRVRLAQLFSFAFDVDEEMDQPRYEGTLTQALMLLNGKLVAGGSTALPMTAIGAIAGSTRTDAQKVEQVYLRTLSRRPTDDELAAGVAYLAQVVAPAAPAVSAAATAPAKKQGKPGKGKGKGGGKDPTARLDTTSRTSDPKTAALEDLMWATLNSSEFVLNH